MDQEEEKSISQQWRKRLEEIGQDAYEFEEMTRLGFLGEKKVTERKNRVRYQSGASRSRCPIPRNQQVVSC